MKSRLWNIVVGGLMGALLWAGPVGAEDLFPDFHSGCRDKLNTCLSSLGMCQTDLAACKAEPSAVLPGTGIEGEGPPLSYTPNGDSTVTDNNTLLMWEIKTGTLRISNPSDPHDVNNVYTWSASGADPDGTLFTVFLDTLNGKKGSPCFAGYCDWRIPNVKELQSIVDYSRAFPAISDKFPGPTASIFYWSHTPFGEFPLGAYFVGFNAGDLFLGPKEAPFAGRAVRGGQ